MDQETHDKMIEALADELNQLRRKTKQQDKEISETRTKLLALANQLNTLRAMQVPTTGKPIQPKVSEPEIPQPEDIQIPTAPKPTTSASILAKRARRIPRVDPKPKKEREPSQAWHNAKEFFFKIAGRPPKGESIEIQLVTYWGLRVGMVVLVVTLVLFARKEEINPIFKAALGYLLALAMAAGSHFFTKRNLVFGRAMFAAALSIGFFVSFAAHFLQAMYCMAILPSGILMSVFIAAILWSAERWKLQFVASLAVLLGNIAVAVASHEAGLNPFLLMLILAAAAVFLSHRHGWLATGLLALFLSFANLFQWMVVNGREVRSGDPFWDFLTYMTILYALFLASDVYFWMRRSGKEEEVNRQWVMLGVFNPLFYFALASLLFLLTKGKADTLHWLYFPLAAIQLALSWVHLRGKDKAADFFASMGATLLLLGAFSAFDGLARNAILAAYALLLLIVSMRLKQGVYYVMAQLAMVVSFIDFLYYRANTTPTPRDYWGGLFSAAVYCTKSVLESNWKPLRIWRTSEHSTAQINSLLSWSHALLGGGMAIYVTHARFELPGAMLAFSIIALLLFMATSLTKSRPLLGSCIEVLYWSHGFIVFEILRASVYEGLQMSTTVSKILAPVFPWLYVAIAALVISVMLLQKQWLQRYNPASLFIPVTLNMVTLLILAFSSTVLALYMQETWRDLAWSSQNQAALPFLCGICFLIIAGFYKQWLAAAPSELGQSTTKSWYTFIPAGLGAWILCIAFICAFGSVPGLRFAMLLAIALAVMIRVRTCYVSGSALALAFSLAVFFTTAGPVATSSGYPLTTILLWLLTSATAILIEWKQAKFNLQRESLLSLTVIITFIAHFILYFLVIQQLPQHFIYPALSAFGVFAIVLGLMRRCPAYAFSALLLFVQAHMLFYFHWISHELSELDIAHILLPLTIVGLLTACGERLLLGNWSKYIPNSATKPKIPESLRNTLRHPMLIALALLVIMVPNATTLLGKDFLTIGWILGATALIFFGMAVHSALYRYYGMAVVGLAILRIVLHDTVKLDSTTRLAVYALMAVCLIGFSLLYLRYKDKIKEWL
jgi:hypothetical protein